MNIRRLVKTNFRQIIYALRLRGNWTQAELGKMLGVSIRTIAKWESNEIDLPRPDRLLSLKRAAEKIGQHEMANFFFSLALQRSDAVRLGWAAEVTAKLDDALCSVFDKKLDDAAKKLAEVRELVRLADPRFIIERA